MNFFMTGGSSFKANVDISLITPAGSHGANFSADGQTLPQSLSIAREVFSRVEVGKIDFVLIGLEPDVLFQGGTVDENLDALIEYVKLCASSGSKAVCVILPVAPNVRVHVRRKFVTPLREILSALKDLCDFTTVDLFDLPMPENYFVDETLTSDGAAAVSTILAFELYERKIFTFAELRRMNYGFFYRLSFCLTPKIFHELMDKIFRATIDELKRKDRIKIAFVTDHADVWCGDDLYNMFANNPRFEPTIFLCLAKVDSTVSTMAKEISHGVEQFKARGLNVVAVFDENEEIPPQDLVIFLRPYDEFLPKSFRSDALMSRTLTAYIHYGCETTVLNYYKYPMFRVAWKSFFDGELTRKLFDTQCRIGMPVAHASGLPKMDVFFDAAKFSFPWKMTRPDAKKIIWAPHWSIADEKSPGLYGTFRHNFRFMYEFAKNHPETSWVVKPHPLLPRYVLETGLFPSAEAFEDYLRAWNNLPNALVFTGAYYQDIFATSDGMIHDSCSFIAEYQYTHKPMIFLTRPEQSNLTELGERILDVSYRVDGRDLEKIAALMQKVFIEGNDPLKDARQKVFDELLNYRRVNGISASEYIFHAIADELGA